MPYIGRMSATAALTRNACGRGPGAVAAQFQEFERLKDDLKNKFVAAVGDDNKREVFLKQVQLYVHRAIPAVPLRFAVLVAHWHAPALPGQVRKHRHKPQLGAWFMERFPEPAAWFQARLAFTRTTAVMSMVGYVIGCALSFLRAGRGVR